MSPNPSSSSSVRKSGKRTPSTDRPSTDRTGNVDFEFLNFSHPSDAKASEARRTVRSHVTRQQHQREQSSIAAARRTKSLPQTTGEQRARPTSQALTHAASYPSPRTSTATEALTIQTSGSEASSYTSSIHSRTASPASPVKTLIGWDQTLLESYPGDWHSSIPVVMEHCKSTRRPISRLRMSTTKQRQSFCILRNS